MYHYVCSINTALFHDVARHVIECTRLLRELGQFARGVFLLGSKILVGNRDTLEVE